MVDERSEAGGRSAVKQTCAIVPARLNQGIAFPGSGDLGNLAR